MPHEPTQSPFEYSAIDERVLIGTNACCQAHFDETLLKEGVTADISLEGELVDHPYGVASYVWLPTPDHQPPTRAAVDIGAAALQKMLDNGQRVFIHCKNGHGRGPTFYAAFLIISAGMTAADAIARVKAKRPGTHLEPAQRTFLQQLEAEVTG